jgi:hypothetical protein
MLAYLTIKGITNESGLSFEGKKITVQLKSSY